jgi:glutamyl-tRNA reductase
MNEIGLIGLNHKTASVAVRECLAFSAEDGPRALDALKTLSAVAEALLLSTCNRVEVLFTTTDPDQAAAQIQGFIARFKQQDPAVFGPALYRIFGDEAVRHVFRVAASLDSMMVGEPQILGQIKDAFRQATSQKTSGVVINRLMHRAFFVAKRVRSETGIGDHAVSISFAAIELGRKIFGTLEGKNVLLIGAGEMAELAVEHLLRHKAGQILVANRTFERGMALARRFNGRAVQFEELADCLKTADIIISSTGSPDWVLKRDQVKDVLKQRKNRPLFFIDIAVPRDIDPSINQLDNAYVYDIDDLKGVIEDNIADRRKEAAKADRIVDEAVVHFRHWCQSLDVVPTIVALQKKLTDMAEAEVKKTLSGLNHLSVEDGEALHRMSRALVKKILHDPAMFLKSQISHGDKAFHLDLARRMFNLDADAVNGEASD